MSLENTDMNTPFDAEVIKQRISCLQESPEYRQACNQFQSELDRFSVIAANAHSLYQKFQSAYPADTVRHEYASQSTLRRGFYCPSPVIELIVRNIHRGRILKRITSRSNPTHEYGFSASGKLLWCTTLRNGAVSFTEYLSYENNRVYGFMFDAYGRLCTLTEEIYENDKIVSYSHCLCLTFDTVVRCASLEREDYFYDAEGLCCCEWYDYHTPSALPTNLPEAILSLQLPVPVYRHNQYAFNRRNGYIESYVCNGLTYYPRFRKKA